MEKIHDFKESIIVGEYGEELIKKYLVQNPKIKEIEDVSKDTYYQNRDIDFIIQFKNGTACSIEIKTDTYTSGNIFFETTSNLEYNVIGCMYKTKADYLFYYFTKTRELYILDMVAYREWFADNKHNFQKKYLKNKNKGDTGTYTSIGYTIPKIFLEKNFKKYKKVIL